MPFVDALREKWERWTPRERRLVVALVLTGVLCIFAGVGKLISDGLGSLESKNAAARDALRMIDDNRDELLAAKSKQGNAAAALEGEAPALSTYLEEIANELGIQILESTERGAAPKGKYTEKLAEVKLKNITLQELAEFLKRVETKSPQVVTQRLYVQKGRFGDKEKLDSVELTIASYEKAKPDNKKKDKEKEKSGSGSGSGSEGG